MTATKKDLLTLEQVSNKLKRSTETIKDYVKDYYEPLGLKIETFDYLFDPKLVQNLQIIKGLKKAGEPAVDIAKYLSLINGKRISPRIEKLAVYVGIGSFLLSLSGPLISLYSSLKDREKLDSPNVEDDIDGLIIEVDERLHGRGLLRFAL